MIDKAKILIVDDTPENIKVAAGILRNEDYQISFASSGMEALLKVKTIKFDLILLDIMMPEVDGFEVCTQLKNNPDNIDIPIIFLTAKAETENIVKGFSLGAVDYLTKPINGAELKARVKTQLELGKTRKQLKENNQYLEQVIEQEERLFSIIAHDLKNPLGSLAGLLGLLVENSDNFHKQKAKDLTLRAYQTSKTTYTLLENLLEWSSSKSKRHAFDLTPTDINKLILRNADLIESIADDKKITVYSEFCENKMVMADDNTIDTVLRNLLSNAVKYTQEGGDIIIKTAIESNKIRVSVLDNGVGLSDYALEKIKKSSLITSSPGTKNEKGTGLGLLLSMELLKKCYTELEIKQIPSGGSEFSFLLISASEDEK